MGNLKIKMITSFKTLRYIPITIQKSRFFSEGEKVLEIQGKTAHILRLHLDLLNGI